MSTLHDDEKAKIAEFAESMYPEETSLSRTMRLVIGEAIQKYVEQLPDGNFPPVFQPGERVELVPLRLAKDDLRPGTVVSIDLEPKAHHYLRVRFDDGEERQINPDVMRRIRS